MSNEWLWFGVLAANFGIIALLKRAFGAEGLIAWVVIAAIIANVQVIKLVELFGLTTTLGNIVYAGSFLATDVIGEVWGPRRARRTVLLGLCAIMSATVLMNLALQFEPSPVDESQGALALIFGLLPRIAVASAIAYAVSQLHDVWAFDWWRRAAPNRLWLRNLASTTVSQLLDTVVFTLLAFVGTVPGGVLIEIVVTTYVFKLLVAILDTPMIYLLTRRRASGVNR